MRVVVGLGNPGSAYVGTRHNVGFDVVETLARRWHIALQLTDSHARVARGSIAGTPCLLVEPLTYMNRSGVALAHLEPPPAGPDLVVIHDDLDLGLGCIRVKRGGGTGGHRGLESIVECFGTECTRTRVGIGRPVRGTDVVAFVLSPFSSAERAVVDPAIARAADAVECILREGEKSAMNLFNVRPSGTHGAAAPVGRN
jgi:PTH1 family peptidyl-tRNA hydrolase